MASPVLNGGDEETGSFRPRLVATQRGGLLRSHGHTPDGLSGVVLHLADHLQRAADDGGDYL